MCFVCLFVWAGGLPGRAALKPEGQEGAGGSAAAGTFLTAADQPGIRQAYEAARHRVRESEGGGWEAANPGQQWVTRFDGRGMTVVPESGGWQWGLELARYGFRRDLLEVSGRPQVRTGGQRLDYVSPAGLTEWFINDQRGLEHGFTVAERPARSGRSLETGDRPTMAAEGMDGLEFHFRIRGGLTPEVMPDGRGVMFKGPDGAGVLTYSGLKVWDAGGRPLSSFFKMREAAMVLVVDERGARYPITIDPIAQQAYLKSSNTGVEDWFGAAVAVSGDTVVIGAPQEDSNAVGVNGNQASNSSFNAGAAYVFVRSGSTWTQQAYLKASNTGAGDEFGYSVAISGETIVVGAHREASSSTVINGDGTNNNAEGRGAAYVFVRNGSTWTQQAYLKAPYVVTSGFGQSVTVSGNLVAVGAAVGTASIDEEPLGSGAVYVFSRSGTAWSNQAYLKASNPNWSDFFGNAVAMDGNTLVVGARREGSSAVGVNGDQSDNSAARAGAAYVFVRNGSTWVQQAYLKSNHTGSGEFGASVSVSGDTVVVGAPRDSNVNRGVNAVQSEQRSAVIGAAHVFFRTGSIWMPQSYLKASNATQKFGTSVSISGNLIAVGAPEESSSSTGINGDQPLPVAGSSGAVYAFARQGSNWSQIAFIKASTTGAGDEFGKAVAAGGGWVVAGAPLEDSNAVGVNRNQADDSLKDSGAAYLFGGFNDLSPDIALEGTGNLPNVSTLVFDAVPRNNNGLPVTLTLRNVGSADLTGLTLSAGGLHPNDFLLPSLPRTTLAPGESLQFSLIFRPTGVGSRTGVLMVASNDPDESIFDLILTGMGEDITEIRLAPPVGLKSLPATGGNSFGHEMAMSGGLTVVGAPNYGNFVLPGSAFVMTRRGGGWEQTAVLSVPGSTLDRSFGSSVAISGDTIVVGAPDERLLQEDAGGIPTGQIDGRRSGAVYVFRQAGAVWTLESRLIPPFSATATRQGFGRDVAISGDTLVAGWQGGIVQVFKRVGNGWTVEAELAGTDSASNFDFGAAVAIDGATIAVGAPQESNGAVHLFRRSGASWQLETVLRRGPGFSRDFGQSLALSGDTLLIGVPSEYVPNPTPSWPERTDKMGGAYVYVRNGATWTQEALLLADNKASDDEFGFAVALHGQTAVIGAIGEDSNAKGIGGNGADDSLSRSGAAYVFTRFGSRWTQQAYLKAAYPHSEDRFGQGVAVEGGMIAVGAPGEDSRGFTASGMESTDRATNTGMVYFFNTPGSPALPEIGIAATDALASGSRLDLGEVALGAAGGPQRFTITNSGQATLVVQRPVFTGPQAAEFSLGSQSFPGSLAPGGSVFFDVTFTPGAAGLRAAVLECSSNDSDETPYQIHLTGTGTDAAPLVMAQSAYLKALNTGTGDLFGAAVAVYGDTVVVGAPQEAGSATMVNGNPSDDTMIAAGAAYVFTLRNGRWTQEAYLKGSNTASRDFFGRSVAIHENTIVVGAVRDFSSSGGAAYVFVREGTAWRQQAMLTGGLNLGSDLFGTSVALSGDSLVVGVPQQRGVPPGSPPQSGPFIISGAACVYTRSNTVWTLQAVLKASDAKANDRMGTAVAISGDTVLAGAPLAGSPSPQFVQGDGAAYVFVRSGTQWTEQARFKLPAFIAGAAFGKAVGLDGGLAVVGAPDAGLLVGGGAGSGAVMIYRRTGNDWPLQARLDSPAGLFFGDFGAAVAVSGETILVGDPYENGSATRVNGLPDYSSLNSGAAWLYQFQAGRWNQQSYFKARNNGEGDAFGSSVGLQGRHVIVGAPREDGIGPVDRDGLTNSRADSGAAYPFGIPAPPLPGLTGNSLNIAPADTTPDSADGTDFGTTPLTGGQVSRTFTLTNHGAVTLIPGPLRVEGDHADFTSSALPPSLLPGASATVDVLFDPAAAGIRRAILSFTTNAPAANPFTFTVQGDGLNAVPTGRANNYTLLEDTSQLLFLEGQDADPQPLTYRITRAPQHGQLRGAANNLTYTPDPNFAGDDQFSYVVNDGITDSIPALIRLFVTQVNDPPVVLRPLQDILQIRAGLVSEVDLSTAFNDLETPAGELTYTFRDPGLGVRYRPLVQGARLALEGLVSSEGEILVRATDPDGLFAETSFRFTIKNRPSLITPIPDQRVIIGRPLTLQAAALFTDLDGDPLTFTINTEGSGTPATSAALTGSSLLLTALAPGATVVTLSAADSDGNVVSDSFSISSGTEFPTIQPPARPGMARQTGLLVQTVEIANTTGLPLEGFRLFVGGLPAGVSLYNAASPQGSSLPWVDYRTPMAAGATVSLSLTFFAPNRQADFTPVLQTAPLPDTDPSAGTGTPVSVARMARLPDGSMMIEFISIPGRLYQVQYSDHLTAWHTCPSPVRAGANRVQWVDRGPPDTQMPPSQTATRYYRIQEISPADSR